MFVKFQKINSNATVPKYQTSGSSGLDLHSSVKCRLLARETRLINTGLKIEIEKNFEGQVRPRSGLALKYGITVLNSPGTIDSDYRGEVCVILHNTSDYYFDINVGDRIAQLVICPVVQAEVVEVEALCETERGEGGFGSTGK